MPSGHFRALPRGNLLRKWFGQCKNFSYFAGALAVCHFRGGHRVDRNQRLELRAGTVTGGFAMTQGEQIARVCYPEIRAFYYDILWNDLPQEVQEKLADEA